MAPPQTRGDGGDAEALGSLAEARLEQLYKARGPPGAAALVRAGLDGLNPKAAEAAKAARK